MGAFFSRVVRRLRRCMDCRACCCCGRPSDRPGSPPPISLEEVESKCQMQRSDKRTSVSASDGTAEASRHSTHTEDSESAPREANLPLADMAEARMSVPSTADLFQAEMAEEKISVTSTTNLSQPDVPEERTLSVDLPSTANRNQLEMAEERMSVPRTANLSQADMAEKVENQGLDEGSRTESAPSDKSGETEARDTSMKLEGCADPETKDVELDEQSALAIESGRKRVEENLTALEASLDATDKLPGAVRDVLSIARMLLKRIRKACTEQDEAFTADELVISLHQSLGILEKLLDCVEARPTNVSDVIGAVKELIAALKAS